MKNLKIKHHGHMMTVYRDRARNLATGNLYAQVGNTVGMMSNTHIYLGMSKVLKIDNILTTVSPTLTT